MTKKLTMTVGTARRAVRNLVLLAAVAAALGARADIPLCSQTHARKVK